MNIPNKVREQLALHNLDKDILEFELESGSVAQAALAANVSNGEIAKTLSFRLKKQDRIFIIVMSGDMGIDNKKFKAYFNEKTHMLKPEETLSLIGHPVGGVCPFGLKSQVGVYFDKSLLRYDYTYPACGTNHSAIKITIENLEKVVKPISWIDVTKQL